MDLLDTKRFQAPSFTRVTFHSSAGRDYWGPMIESANRGSYEAELMSVAQGLRRCGTLHIPNVDGDATYQRLAAAGVKWLRLAKVGHSSGFSHRRHPPVKDGDPNFSWFSVIGLDAQDLKDFALAHSKSNHAAMGRLLGFPSCCRGFFNKNWPKYCDPIWQSALNTEGVKRVALRQGSTQLPVNRVQVAGHPGCNVMLRYIGVRTWFHLPCSLRCEATIRLSDTWMSLIRERSEASFTATKLLLSLPLAWDVCHGYARVITPAFTVHAGSTESRSRYVVEYQAHPSGLPAGDLPGAVQGMEWPMRPGDLNTAPLHAAGGLT